MWLCCRVDYAGHPAQLRSGRRPEQSVHGQPAVALERANGGGRGRPVHPGRVLDAVPQLREQLLQLGHITAAAAAGHSPLLGYSSTFTTVGVTTAVFNVPSTPTTTALLRPVCSSHRPGLNSTLVGMARTPPSKIRRPLASVMLTLMSRTFTVVDSVEFDHVLSAGDSCAVLQVPSMHIATVNTPGCRRCNAATSTLTELPKPTPAHDVDAHPTHATTAAATADTSTALNTLTRVMIPRHASALPTPRSPTARMLPSCTVVVGTINLTDVGVEAGTVSETVFPARHAEPGWPAGKVP